MVIELKRKIVDHGPYCSPTQSISNQDSLLAFFNLIPSYSESHTTMVTFLHGWIDGQMDQKSRKSLLIYQVFDSGELKYLIFHK